MKGNSLSNYTRWIVSITLSFLLVISHVYLQTSKSNAVFITRVGYKIFAKKIKKGTELQEDSLYKRVYQELIASGVKEKGLSLLFRDTTRSPSIQVLDFFFEALSVMVIFPVEIQQKDAIVDLKVLVIGKPNFYVSLKFEEMNDSLILLGANGLNPIIERINCYKEYKNSVINESREKLAVLF